VPEPIDRDRIVAALDEVWSSVADLGADLTEAEWDTPTALPGWSVRDNVAHMLGTESMLAGRPAPEVSDEEVAAAGHVRNEIGASNERTVVAWRGRTGAELLAAFREVTAERSAALHAMSAADFAAPSWTPAGQATYGRFMQIRVFDCWMHEQDVREALGRPGHLDGAAPAVALAEVEQALGYLVGKRAGAPDGTSVTFALTGPVGRDFHVAVDGRAQVVDAHPGPATVTIGLPFDVFLRLAGGRRSGDDALAAGEVDLRGDEALGRAVVTNLAYTI